MARVNITSGEKGVEGSTAGWSIKAYSKSLTLESSGEKSDWNASEIEGLYSSARGDGGPGFGLHAALGDEQNVDLGRIGDERNALDLLESLAANLEVRFDEHTGRSVEADEHGMNVIEQIQTFPDRWPIITNSDVGLVKFTQVGRFVCFTIPSVVSGRALALFAVTFVLALIAGVPTTTAIQPEGALSGWLVLLAPAIALVGLWYYGTMKNGWLEARHEIRMHPEKITVIPRFLGLFSMGARPFDIADFRDLDVAADGRLTFLFGNERISCVMDGLESEFVLGEVANRIETLGLADRAASEQE